MPRRTAAWRCTGSRRTAFRRAAVPRCCFGYGPLDEPTLRRGVQIVANVVRTFG